MTRMAPTARLAPPARAANPPRRARKANEVAETRDLTRLRRDRCHQKRHHCSDGEADSRHHGDCERPIVPNQPSLRPKVISGRSGLSGAKASPEILPNPHYVSRWPPSGRRFGPRKGARCTRQPKPKSDSIPIEHGPAQFNAFYPAVLRHHSCRTPEQLPTTRA